MMRSYSGISQVKKAVAVLAFVAALAGSASAQAGPGSSLPYDGRSYKVVPAAKDFISLVKAGSPAAFPFTFDAYSARAKELMDAASAVGLEPEAVFSPSLCVCKACSYELPASAVLSVLMGGGGNMLVLGGSGGVNPASFAADPKCPACGGRTFCFLSLAPASTGVTAQDVKDIKPYFRYLAGLWWQRNSGSKMCDDCYADVPEYGGYIYGMVQNGYLKAYRLYCEACMDDMLSDPALLEKLQKNPNYLGDGLMEKVKEHKRKGLR